MPDTQSESLLAMTLAAAAKDGASVLSDGTPLAAVPEGSLSRPSRTHIDDRGSVTEIFDKRWGFHDAPVHFIYTYTMLPDRVKGWGLHQFHEDRYFLVKGRMMIVCYDVRPDSATSGQISKIVLDEANPRLVTIPSNVWHANINIGEEELRVINLPTLPYDHANPDKLRLPINTPLIPFTFPSNVHGW